MSSDICSSPTVFERPAATPSSSAEPHPPRRKITYVSTVPDLLRLSFADRQPVGPVGSKARYAVFSSRLITFPVALRGSSSRNITSRGTL